VWINRVVQQAVARRNESVRADEVAKALLAALPFPQEAKKVFGVLPIEREISSITLSRSVSW